MIIAVHLPLTHIPDPNLTLLVQAGKDSAIEALNRQTQDRAEAETFALDQANDLLNAGYTLIFRERLATEQGDALILYFHQAPTPMETVEQTAIKEAFRIYHTPPHMGGTGEHPDTLRLNAIMKSLMRSGILPDDTPPVTDDTQVDVTPRTLREGSR